VPPRRSPVLVDFGRRVRTLRDARGWSQEELAEKAGIHRTYIGGIERGLRNVALLNIVRIAHALDLSVSDLFSYQTRSPRT
jgi:transcriptional regulator with XRE-family HTH domain